MTDFSLLFDGSNDGVDRADSNAWDPGAVMTIECWVNCTNNSLHAAQTYLKKDSQYILRMDIQKPRFLVWTSVTGLVQADSNMVLPAGWNHIAGVYDGAEARIYVNGVRKAQVAATGNVSTSGSAVTIGIGAADEGFPGNIDEMRVSNNVRYTGASFTVPTAPFESDANTIALYHFDDGTGLTLTDSGPNSLHGTLRASTATPTWSTTTAGLIVPAEGGNGLLMGI